MSETKRVTIFADRFRELVGKAEKGADVNEELHALVAEIGAANLVARYDATETWDVDGACPDVESTRRVLLGDELLVEWRHGVELDPVSSGSFWGGEPYEDTLPFDRDILAALGIRPEILAIEKIQKEWEAKMDAEDDE